MVKLMNYRIRFLLNYFDKRMHSIKLGDQKSKPLRINIGVPQGSVSGPLIFDNYELKINTKLFADDTTLSF